jgi:hypothetical protein
VLTVPCRVPGVTVDIDGARVAFTPVREPLLVPAGARTIHFSRPGYRDVTHNVVLSPSHATNVACNLAQETSLGPEVAAALSVRTSPRDAAVFVDGQRFRGAALPSGPHELHVEHDGFKTWTQSVTLRAQRTNNYDVRLQPTETYRRRQAHNAGQRRLFGYVGLGGGFAFVAGGAGLLAWNGGRYSDWHDDRSRENYGKQLQTVSSIQRVDDVAIASMALGTGLLAAGAWLLLGKPASGE